MSEIPFDLKLQPDWVKESAAPNPYARFEGYEDDSRGNSARQGKFRTDDRRGFRGQPSRGNDSRGPRRPGGPGGPSGGGRPQGGERRGDQGNRPGNRGDHRGEKGRPPFRGEGTRDSRDQQRGPRPPQAPAVPETPAPVFVEFLPDAACITAIARQIKETGHAYPLFDLARLFLARPERHRVKIVANDATQPLFQAGEGGSVALNAAQLEQRAFATSRDQFYTVETQQTEEIKGTFTRVARCRISGVLLGPSNHHSYQAALRRLYDTRFSRRMSFEEFSRNNIENVDDPAVVEAWKEQARQITVWKTKDEENPLTFNSEADAERHFREHHLPSLIQQKTTLEISGEVSRRLSDQRLANAIRNVWEKQRGYPGQMMYHLRRAFNAQGLHVFKHRKQRLYVTSHRPVTFSGGSGLSSNIASILEHIAAHPQCTRADLAAKLLPENHEDPEFPRLKSALAADFHWLVQSGHLIEFQDGKLDLPLQREAGGAGHSAKDEADELEAHAEPVEASAEAAAPAPAPEVVTEVTAPEASAPAEAAVVEPPAPEAPVEAIAPEPVIEAVATPVVEETPVQETPAPEAAVSPEPVAEAAPAPVEQEQPVNPTA
ncbi:MAG: hypothetical protein QM796_18060 [Chthoniobacteraceae bacterium]